MYQDLRQGSIRLARKGFEYILDTVMGRGAARLGAGTSTTA